jgi:hypothetical protein
MGSDYDVEGVLRAFLLRRLGSKSAAASVGGRLRPAQFETTIRSVSECTGIEYSHLHRFICGRKSLSLKSAGALFGFLGLEVVSREEIAGD